MRKDLRQTKNVLPPDFYASFISRLRLYLILLREATHPRLFRHIRRDELLHETADIVAISITRKLQFAKL